MNALSPPARILIVDDNDLARRIVRDVVVALGGEVCAEARNGQEAVEMNRQYRPNLVILDFLMPIKDGLQTAAEILEMDPTVPIVMNTLYLTDQLRTAAEQIGVRQIVPKSNYKSLRDALDSLMGGEGKPKAPH